MTFEEAAKLQFGDYVHTEEPFDKVGCVLNIGPRGGVRFHTTPWRVNGRVRLWKTQPGRIEIPCKVRHVRILHIYTRTLAVASP